jgi:hypothetical protein
MPQSTADVIKQDPERVIPISEASSSMFDFEFIAQLELIPDAVQNARHIECLDALIYSKFKDRVYGLLGMVKKEEQEDLIVKFTINYDNIAISVTDVFTNAAIFVLTSGSPRALNIYEDFKLVSDTLLDKPSWLPDLGACYQNGS